MFSPRERLLQAAAYRVAELRQNGPKGAVSVEQIIRDLCPEMGLLVRSYVDSMSDQAMNRFRRECLRLAKTITPERRPARAAVRRAVFTTWSNQTHSFGQVSEWVCTWELEAISVTPTGGERG
jgi:hypothetical protein